jgi:hypothetical protein
MLGRTLVAIAALIEAVMGLALILQPASVVRLLLGGDISGVGVGLGRVAGFGLLSLGVACWPRTAAALPALQGMLTYNALAAGYLGYLLIGGELVGRLLLPAVALHALLTVLFAGTLVQEQRARLGDVRS